MSTLNKNLWWGYLHTSGTKQVKRFFSDLDITEAKESSFAVAVFGPIEASSREEALLKLFPHEEER